LIALVRPVPQLRWGPGRSSYGLAARLSGVSRSATAIAWSWPANSR